MPAFFEIFAPTLAMPPPLFTPQFPAMVEMDTLPDIGVGTNAVESEQLSTTAPTTEASSSSFGTTAQKNVQLSTPQDSDQHQDQQQSLIVSADGQSNEIMEETGNEERMRDEAERKTLAYENALLRQALEQMGCKSLTKSYLEGSAKIETKEMEEPVNSLTEEVEEMKLKIASLESDLSKAKQEVLDSDLKLTKLKESVKKNDKISHSSFNVGDVGLFMPTGRAGRHKRTYLAFHSSCPHRYLSPDSIEGSPDYILGRIVFQEELTAGPQGSESNPYGLHPGTRFWMLSVETLKVP